MTSDLLQLRPYGTPAPVLPIVTTSPPSTDSFRTRLPSVNATHRPSGEKVIFLPATSAIDLAEISLTLRKYTWYPARPTEEYTIASPFGDTPKVGPASASTM